MYHVTAQAVCGASLFVDDEDRRAFFLLLEFVIARFELTCWAYCLMGTHYHLVLEGRRERLSDGMKRLNERYARHFNKRHGRRGHIFAERYSAYVIEDEGHFEEACKYIAANPVRAGLCETVGDWPWSWVAGDSARVGGPARRVPVPAVNSSVAAGAAVSRCRDSHRR
jgi:REP element-mobilizing transposase RayT